MMTMTEPSGTTQPEQTGWALVLAAVRELVRDMLYPTPRRVRYLRCDGCGQATAHSSNQGLITMDRAGITAPPPEAVCDECGHAQPRTVGDELRAEVTVVCVGRRRRRFGAKRSRRRCGQAFEVPAAASRVLCPWCSTVQPGPGRLANP
jgi:hypothetical protein